MFSRRGRNVSKPSHFVEFKKLLQQVGLPIEALDSVLGPLAADFLAWKQLPRSVKGDEQLSPSLPSSDINLGSGAACLRVLHKLLRRRRTWPASSPWRRHMCRWHLRCRCSQNGAEEWKYLSALTSNCRRAAFQVSRAPDLCEAPSLWPKTGC